MFKTLVGAFKNKDIRKKIIYTLLILVVVRVGSLLPIPGVDTNYFSSLLSGINTGDLSYLSAFTGGSFERMVPLCAEHNTIYHIFNHYAASHNCNS